VVLDELESMERRLIAATSRAVGLGATDDHAREWPGTPMLLPSGYIVGDSALLTLELERRRRRLQEAAKRLIAAAPGTAAAVAHERAFSTAQAEFDAVNAVFHKQPMQALRNLGMLNDPLAPGSTFSTAELRQVYL
jgi:hypothetical protein